MLASRFDETVLFGLIDPIEANDKMIGGIDREEARDLFSDRSPEDYHPITNLN